jgi:hypothetical protein
MFYHVTNTKYILHTYAKRYISNDLNEKKYFQELNIIIIEIFKFQQKLFTCMFMH